MPERFSAEPWPVSRWSRKPAGTRHRGPRGTGPLSRAPTVGVVSMVLEGTVWAGLRRGGTLHLGILRAEQVRPAGQGLEPRALQGGKARLWCPAVPRVQIEARGLGRLSCRSGSTQHAHRRPLYPASQATGASWAWPVSPTPTHARSPGCLRPEGRPSKTSTSFKDRVRGGGLPGSQGRNEASLWGRDPGPVCLGNAPCPPGPGTGPWPPEALAAPASSGSRLGQLALQGATHHPAPGPWPASVPGDGLVRPALASAAPTVWPGVALTSPPWPGVTTCPHRISPHRQAGRAILLTPCGPPQGLHQAHCSRLLLRPDSARPLHKAQARSGQPQGPACPPRARASCPGPV